MSTTHANDQTDIGSVDVQDSDETECLTRDEIFELLSNRRRRFALQYLKTEGLPVALSDLAERVAAWENGSTVQELSSSERKTVYSSLQQFHLPKMDETGVVEFDRRAGTVTLTDAAEELDIYLEIVDRYDIPWSSYYMGVSLLGVILVSLSSAGVAPFSVVPAMGWSVFLLGTFLVSSISHYLLSRRMRLTSRAVPPEVDDA